MIRPLLCATCSHASLLLSHYLLQRENEKYDITMYEARPDPATAPPSSATRQYNLGLGIRGRTAIKGRISPPPIPTPRPSGRGARPTHASRACPWSGWEAPHGWLLRSLTREASVWFRAGVPGLWDQVCEAGVRSDAFYLHLGKRRLNIRQSGQGEPSCIINRGAPPSLATLLRPFLSSPQAPSPRH